MHYFNAEVLARSQFSRDLRESPKLEEIILGNWKFNVHYKAGISRDGRVEISRVYLRRDGTIS